MAVTAAEKRGEGVIPGLGTLRFYDLTLDDSHLAAGENVDLTDDFSLIDAAWICGSTLISTVKMDLIIPAKGTAVSATNVKFTAHWSTDAAGAMTPAPDTTNVLAIVGVVTIAVIGKPAANS